MTFLRGVLLALGRALGTASWVREKAEQGDADAQCNLGLMYARGREVPQDYQEAVKWYRRAAEQGDAVAQFNLGVMYATGEGVPQDHQEAVKWYRLAAEQGHPDAQYTLELHEKTEPGPMSSKYAAALTDSSKLGYAPAGMLQESSAHDAASNQDVAPAAKHGRQDWVPERWWHRLLSVLIYGSTVLVLFGGRRVMRNRMLKSQRALAFRRPAQSFVDLFQATVLLSFHPITLPPFEVGHLAL